VALLASVAFCLLLLALLADVLLHRLCQLALISIFLSSFVITFPALDKYFPTTFL